MATRSLMPASASRRRLVLGVPAGCASAWLVPHTVVRAASYPTTIEAMTAARDTEANVYYHYAEFGRQAQREGYRGVAYLFGAVAASEMVHATNFARVLARLGADVPPAPKPVVKGGTTKENLMRAASGELHSIDSFYPKLLERITPEGFDDAITSVRWAWESEKQHRDKMQQILRWSPSLFETVARTIDKKTGQYFVCQLCGSTTNAIPSSNCPVCAQPSSHYRLIEPPAA
jgi:rubrerythrin